MEVRFMSSTTAPAANDNITTVHVIWGSPEAPVRTVPYNLWSRSVPADANRAVLHERYPDTCIEYYTDGDNYSEISVYRSGVLYYYKAESVDPIAAMAVLINSTPRSGASMQGPDYLCIDGQYMVLPKIDIAIDGWRLKGVRPINDPRFRAVSNRPLYKLTLADDDLDDEGCNTCDEYNMHLGKVIDDYNKLTAKYERVLSQRNKLGGYVNSLVQRLNQYLPDEQKITHLNMFGAPASGDRTRT